MIPDDHREKGENVRIKSAQQAKYQRCRLKNVDEQLTSPQTQAQRAIRSQFVLDSADS